MYMLVMYFDYIYIKLIRCRCWWRRKGGGVGEETNTKILLNIILGLTLHRPGADPVPTRLEITGSH